MVHKYWSKFVGRVLSNKEEDHALDKDNAVILNEAINFDKEVIFIAIPKTGTTTIRRQIRETGVPIIRNPHLDINQIRDTIYTYLLIINLGKNTSFPTTDVIKDSDLRNQAKYIFNTFFKFSSVRNPWARAVSLYFRQEGIQERGNLEFDEFCEKHFYASDTCRQPTLHKNQIDWLSDKNGYCIMDYIYKLENYAKAVQDIYDRTDGRLQLTYQIKNKNPISLSSKYREMYNDKTKKIIEKRFQKDIDYFKYTF